MPEVLQPAHAKMAEELGKCGELVALQPVNLDCKPAVVPCFRIAHADQLKSSAVTLLCSSARRWTTSARTRMEPDLMMHLTVVCNGRLAQSTCDPRVLIMQRTS